MAITRAVINTRCTALLQLGFIFQTSASGDASSSYSAGSRELQQHSGSSLAHKEPHSGSKAQDNGVSRFIGSLRIAYHIPFIYYIRYAIYHISYTIYYILGTIYRIRYTIHLHYVCTTYDVFYSMAYVASCVPKTSCDQAGELESRPGQTSRHSRGSRTGQQQGGPS